MRWLVSTAAAAFLAACASAGDGGHGDGDGDAGSGAAASVGSTATGDGGRGGEGAPAPCAGYATDPIGVEEGDVLSPDVVLHGLIEGSEAESSVALGELRDCDGRTGVNAVLLIEARASCDTCRREAVTLAADAATWAEAGVRTVILMTGGDIALWRRTYDLDGVAILADPGRTLDLPEPPHEPSGGFQQTPNGTPLYVVLDPRTGRIHQRHLGATWVDDELLALAARNAADR